PSLDSRNINQDRCSFSLIFLLNFRKLIYVNESYPILFDNETRGGMIMAQHQNSTNKKTIFFLFSLSLVMLISLCMVFLFYPDEQSFDDTLTVSLDRIDKVVMSDLEEPGIYKTTTDPKEI